MKLAGEVSSGVSLGEDGVVWNPGAIEGVPRSGAPLFVSRVDATPLSRSRRVLGIGKAALDVVQIITKILELLMEAAHLHRHALHIGRHFLDFFRSPSMAICIASILLNTSSVCVDRKSVV